MKIIIDNIIFSLQKSGGISVVWYELISRLLKEKNIEIDELNFMNKNIFYNKANTSRKLFPLERYYNPKLNAEKRPFIFHSSYYRYSTNPNAINITTVHDFTYEHFYTGFKKNIHFWQKKNAILNSKYIICISENTKNDLLHFIPMANIDNIKVINNGVSSEYFPIENINTHKLPYKYKSYILFIGSRANYKNFLYSVKCVSQTNYNFVIVGPPLSQEEKQYCDKYFKNKDRYLWMGFINNADLNVIYNGAFCLLYPSSYEGFGIPIIECQKAGCPTIAYNSSSIPEIIGDESLLLNHLTTNEFNRILNCLENPYEYSKIINNGYINAKKFSWDLMYKNIRGLYLEAWNKFNKQI